MAIDTRITTKWRYHVGMWLTDWEWRLARWAESIFPKSGAENYQEDRDWEQAMKSWWRSGK